MGKASSSYRPTTNGRTSPSSSTVSSHLPIPLDLLVVDDNSPDGTGRVADELAARHPQIHVLHRAEKDGLGRAYCAGFAWALERSYEFIFEMDGDFSHNPADIPQVPRGRRRVPTWCWARAIAGASASSTGR